MIKISPNDALFKQLKKDYDSHKKNKLYQSQLQSGFDYMEAMIKFFGVLSISVVKSMDETLYKKIFTNNFKLSPSLGDYKSLATTPFSVNSKKIISTLTSNELYNFLDNLFSKKIELKLTDTASILEDKEKTIKVKSTLFLLDEYAVSFRNKIKGHGASFKSDEKKLRDLILKNLDELLLYMENDYIQIAQEIDFFSNGHNTNEILIKYKTRECKLLPIISYITCDKYSCNDKHRTKLFFYNDGKATKSHYLDYSYNHFHQFTQTNEIYQNLEILQNEILHSTSNTHRQSLLLSDFVGRIKELKDTKAHILNSMECQQSSFVSLMGIPGIGKSAFLTQLQQSLIDDEILKNKFNSYTFYVQKDNMGARSEEDKYLWKHFHTYFSNQGISINTNQNEVFNLRNNLEQLFKAYEENTRTKPLLLIIDGLDEFTNPSDMIQSIPLSFNSKIHLIYSSRPYSNIKDVLASTLSTSEHLNIFKFELGKLLINEVEELLSHVLSKDIPRESKDYKEIVEIIAKHSESLPLYIYYITQALKEKNIANSLNVTKHIKEWAKQLPPKLSDFYLQQFKNTSSLSRDILLMLYLSKSSVSKEDFYTILKKIRPEEFKMTDGKTIDEVLFIDKYFNAIEVFLHIDSDNKYNFYHLSVREQIVSYLQELKQAFRFNQTQLKEVIYESVVEHYSDYIENMLYLKKNSDIYNLLVQLTKKVDKDDTPSYYKDNYFHLLNTLIWANIHISQINHEDMYNEEYVSLLETKEITKETIQEIQHFYELFENKKEKHLHEIRYAYELAFIAKDYSQVLVYKDMYEDFVHDMFLEIILNLDKLEYIQKFIKHKDDWNNALSKEVQDFFVSTIENYETLDDSFSEVLEFMDDEYKNILLTKLSYSEALKIVARISDYDYKYKATLFIATQIIETDIDTALNTINDFFDDESDKLKAINSILSATVEIEVEKILTYLETISNYYDKSRVLTTIAKKVAKTDIDKALEIIKSLYNDYGYGAINKATALTSIISVLAKTDIEKALEITNTIHSIDHKSKVLTLITPQVAKIDINRALEITNILHDNHEDNIFNKSKALTSIVSVIAETDIEKALEITHTIPDDRHGTFQGESLGCIASKVIETDFDSAINIARKFPISSPLLSLLPKIAKKDINMALDITSNLIEYEIGWALYSIASEFNEKSIDRVLKITESICDKYAKTDALGALILRVFEIDINRALSILERLPLKGRIVKQLQQKGFLLKKKVILKESLKIVKISYFFKEKSEILTLITLQIYKHDINKALIIMKNIIESAREDDAGQFYIYEKLDHLMPIIAIVPEKDIDIALEIANMISSDSYKSEFLGTLVERILEINIVSALRITMKIPSDSYRSKSLLSIVSKLTTVNTKKALQITAIIPNDSYKAEALAIIFSKVSEIDYENVITIIKTMNPVDTFPTSSLFDTSNKAKTFSYLISKLDEINFNKIQILIRNFFSTIEIIQTKDVSSYSNSKLPNFKKTTNNFTNIFNNQLFICKINIINTLPILTELSSDSILKYYNVPIDFQGEKSSSLKSIIKDFQNLTYKKENRQDFRNIKNKIEDDNLLLKEFISYYGENMGINNIDDFDEKFTFKNLNTIISLFSKET